MGLQSASDVHQIDAFLMQLQDDEFKQSNICTKSPEEGGDPEGLLVI